MGAYFPDKTERILGNLCYYIIILGLVFRRLPMGALSLALKGFLDSQTSARNTVNVRVFI